MIMEFVYVDSINKLEYDDWHPLLTLIEICKNTGSSNSCAYTFEYLM